MVSQQAITVAPGGAVVSKMTTPQKAQTVTALAKPAGVPSTPLSSAQAAPPATPASRVTVVSQVGFLFELNVTS